MIPSSEADSKCILVVDDDPAMLVMLRRRFEYDGFSVLTAINGQEALGILRRQLPSLAIVDLMMPGMHGFELAAQIKRYADVPIIFLSAVTDIPIKVEGIQQYAEDYLEKPVDLNELMARVNRVLRRVAPAAPAVPAELTIDEHLRINFASHYLLLDSQQRKLTPIESRLLWVLVGNTGRVITNRVLLERAWPPDEEAYDDTLWVHMRRLRQKIEPDPAHPRYIITERGIGYSFRGGEGGGSGDNEQ